MTSINALPILVTSPLLYTIYRHLHHPMQPGNTPTLSHESIMNTEVQGYPPNMHPSDSGSRLALCSGVMHLHLWDGHTADQHPRRQAQGHEQQYMSSHPMHQSMHRARANSKNRKMSSGAHLQSGPTLPGIDYVIEERCNSEQSRTRHNPHTHPSPYDQHGAPYDQYGAVPITQRHYGSAGKAPQHPHRGSMPGNKQKSRNKERLSEHPYLNFFEASDMDQQSLTRGRTPRRPHHQQQTDMVVDSNTQANKYQEVDSIVYGSHGPKLAARQSQQEPVHSGGSGVGCTIISSGSFNQQSILIDMDNISNLANVLGEAKRAKQNRKQVSRQPQVIDQNNSSKSRGNSNNILKIRQTDSVQLSEQQMQNLGPGLKLISTQNQVYLIDGEESSSEDSRANLEMKISQGAPQYPPCTPLHERAIDYSEYYEQKEKILQLEESRSSLQAQVHELQHKLDHACSELQKNKEIFYSQEMVLRARLEVVMAGIVRYEGILAELEGQLRARGHQQGNRASIEQMEQVQREFQQSETKCRALEVEVEQMQAVVGEVQARQAREMARLTESKRELECSLKDAQLEAEQLRAEYEQRENSLREQLQRGQSKLQCYIKELGDKDDLIEQYRNALEGSALEGEDYSQLTSPNYSRRKAKERIGQLQAQCQSLHQEVDELKQKVRELEGDVTRLIGQKQVLRAQVSEQSSRRAIISEGVDEQLAYLRREVVNLNRQLQTRHSGQGNRRQKSEYTELFQTPTRPRINGSIVQPSLSPSLPSSSSLQSTPVPLLPLCNNTPLPSQLQPKLDVPPLTFQSTPPPTSVAAPLTFSTPQRSPLPYLAAYTQHAQHTLHIQQLQTIIIEYQSTLLRNQLTIKQLQQQVLEYLQDAVEKEAENDHLHLRLGQLEEQMGMLWREKVQVQVHNRQIRQMGEIREMRGMGEDRAAYAMPVRKGDKVRSKQEPRSHLLPSKMGRQSPLNTMNHNSTLKLRQLRIE